MNVFVIYFIIFLVILCLFKFFRDFLKSIYYMFKYKRENIEVFGLYCFLGYFGQGKTLSMSNYLLDLQKQCEKYGKKCYIYSNYGLKNSTQITNLDDFYDICMQKMECTNGFSKNDVLLFGFDELQNLFNSRQYNSFPMEFLGILTQMRKLGILVCFTSPLAGLTDKNLRDLSNKFILCKKINRYYFVNYWFSQEDYQAGKMGGIVWNQHWLINPALEESYDTHEFVKSLRNLDYNNPNIRESNVVNLGEESLVSLKDIKKPKRKK